MPTAIRANGLTRRFGDLTAIDHLDLDVPAGRVFGYLGPNGAGKTTTLHILLGILPPTSGSAEVAGFDVAKQPGQVRARCGALLEFNGLYERLTARENLELQGRMHGMAAADRAGRAKELLDAIGLYDRRDDSVATWSRGMKQQLAIARTLMHRPQVVFLDEPTAGFDPAAAAALRDRVRHLARGEGVTVFLTTHNLREAEQVCDTVAVIRQGRVLAVGPPDRLRHGAPVVEVRCGTLPEKALVAIRKLDGVRTAQVPEPNLLRIELDHDLLPNAPIVAALVRSGVAVEEVRRVRPSLEEEFIALVNQGDPHGPAGGKADEPASGPASSTPRGIHA